MSIGESIKPKIIIIVILTVILLGACGYISIYNYIYRNLDIKIKDKTVEYGKSDYKITDYISVNSGKLYNISNSINTNKIGKQRVNIKLKKYFVSKTIPLDIKVVDKVAPVIKIKNSEIVITKGENYNIFDNIESVVDDVDGNLSFYDDLDDKDKDKKGYYVVKSDFDNSKAGTYNVQIESIDKSNNKSAVSFNIKVEEPYVEYKQIIYSQAAPNSNGNGITNVALSLLGTPYVYGGNSPAGFDCSGFVQYAYAQNGIYISRSSSTQAYDGVGINYYDAQPGDIIIWGYGNGQVTHSSIYIGNDMMVHAENPSTGVVQSNVTAWGRGSAVEILYVRRIVS